MERGSQCIYRPLVDLPNLLLWFVHLLQCRPVYQPSQQNLQFSARISTTGNGPLSKSIREEWKGVPSAFTDRSLTCQTSYFGSCTCSNVDLCTSRPSKTFNFPLALAARETDRFQK